MILPRILPRGEVSNGIFSNLTIIARDDQVLEIVEAIVEGARTGKIGDGKVFVSSLEEVARIRSGEIGKAAV